MHAFWMKIAFLGCKFKLIFYLNVLTQSKKVQIKKREDRPLGKQKNCFLEIALDILCKELFFLKKSKRHS